MKNLGIILLVFSLIIAAVLSYGIFTILDKDTQVEVVEKEKNVYVASRDLEINEEITDKMITEIKKKESYDTGNLVTKKEDIIGSFVYEKIYQGEGFNKKRIVSRDETMLATRIEAGFRAVSININKFTGVANLLTPGDAVDILVFIPEKKDKDTLIHPNISKLVLQNIKILSIKQNVDRAYKSDKEVDEAKDNYSVTLSVKAEEIENLILAENIGFIKLALRPIGEDIIVDSYGITWKEILTDSQLRIRSFDLQYPINDNIYEINHKKNMIIYDKEDEDEEDEDDKEEENNDESSKEIEEFDYYIVKYGDTLMEIARNYYDDENKYILIKEANNIGNNNLIISGEKLKIPKLK